MASPKRIIRKLSRSSVPALGERATLTQGMLAVWAALVTCLVLLLGGFDETRLLHNGWFRLVGVAASWGLLAWAATVPSRWMAQRMRLGVAASLTFHTLLTIWFVFMQMGFLLTPPKPALDRVTVTEPMETPKQVEVTRSTIQKQPHFDAPTPTEQLATTTKPTEAKKLPNAASVAPEPSEQLPQLAAKPIPQAATPKRPRTALTHRAKSPGKRSRQREVAKLAAATPQLIERPTQAPPSSTKSAQPTELAKAPTAPKALASVSAAGQPSKVETTPEPVASAPPKLTRKRDPQPLAAEPSPSAPRERRQPKHVAQAIASQPESRQLAQVTETKSLPEPTITKSSPARPRPTAPQTESTMKATLAEDVQPVAPRVAATRRRTKALPPSPTSISLPAARPSRQLASVQAVAVADAISTAAAVPRSASLTPSASPAPRLLADSRGGTASRGVGFNSTDDSPATPDYSAPFATSAAKRSRSTQTKQGPALTPNPVAKVARARAMAPSPRSSLQALPLPNAQVAGAKQPQATSVSSSAALERQFGNVALGDVTAAKGEAEADTGPPQIAPERGRGRGAKGGRLAMLAPTTKRGLGPRRPAAAPLSRSGASLAVAPLAASSPGSAATSSSSNSPTDSGAPTADQAMRLARAPAGGGTDSTHSSPAMAAVSEGAGSQIPVAPSGSTRRTAAGSPSKKGQSGQGPLGQGQSAGPTIASSGGSGRAEGSRRSVAASPLAASPGPLAARMVSPGAGRSPTYVSTPTGPAASGRATKSPSFDVGRPRRETQLVAQPGIGGIASEVSLDPGLPQRIARRKTQPLRMTPGRYANRTDGGQPTPPGRTRHPAPAYATRLDRQPSDPTAPPTDLTPKTEEAIELGLQFLARLQQNDGRWSLKEFGDLPIAKEELPSINADGAATSLALLAFLGGGYDHFDDKYQAIVQRGLDYLIQQQGKQGDIFPERDQPGSSVVRFYSHGIATLALCEAYGMTGDPNLREPAQRAIDYIIKTQHPTQNGWRYTPGVNSDLSVTGWQMMALRSGELAGLKVDPRTYQRTRKLLERCRQKEGKQALFCYNPYTTSRQSGLRHHGQPGTVMTSVGLLIQLYLGETRESNRAQLGADHLLKNLPTDTGDYTVVPVGTPGNPQRDTYYWYYATQVMFHMRGEYWQQWQEQLHPLLVDQQTQEGELAGSWNPRYPVADRWAPFGGRLYVTCLNLLSLEVSYRHLPLYEMTVE